MLSPYLGPCWLWQGKVSAGGYGEAGSKFNGTIMAHRIMYEWVVGPIPEGLVIDHLCRVRLCVNPAHLEAVTEKENILRGTGPTAIRARKTHCKYGHPLAGANVYRYKNSPYRQCGICMKRRWREKELQRQAQRAA